MTGVDKNEYIAGRSQVEYFEDRELDVEKQGGDVLDMCRGGFGQRVFNSFTASHRQ